MLRQLIATLTIATKVNNQAVRQCLMRLLIVAISVPLCNAVKCLDCVGKDCMGAFCEGDYCIIGNYAPRWGTIEWGESRIVKGCLSGRMLEKNIRSHCETADEDGKEPFTCFCNKDYCNSDKGIRRLETTTVPLVTCVCEGSHCQDKTCIGEMCSYVINHRTKKSEQGCVNASVPLIERRSSGACMIPPITGAMHHTVSKDPHELLATESCVCMTDYCNSEKPEVTIPEKMKCQTFVALEAMGTKVSSRNTTCTGEFCFKASIKSKLGHMTEYKTMGCASFLDEATLVEELQPTGCARFESEKVAVESCFQTNDKRAIGRARASQESVSSKKKGKESKYRKMEKMMPSKMEVEYDDDDDDNDEDEEEEENEKDSRRKSKASSSKGYMKEKEKEKGSEEEEQEGAVKDNEEKEFEEDDKKDEKELEEEEENEEEGNEKKEKSESNVKETTTTIFIFEKPTEPPIPDDSNITLITVFILLMVLIVVSGAVWKFQLHKRLFRANYDTVAGG